MFDDLIGEEFLEYLQKKNDQVAPKITVKFSNEKLKLKAQIPLNIFKNVQKKARTADTSLRDISYDHLEKKKRIKSVLKAENKMIKNQSEILIKNIQKSQIVSDKNKNNVFEDFYVKNQNWKLEAEIQKQKAQKIFQEMELKNCTFSPKITLLKKKEIEVEFTSFSKQTGPTFEEPNLYYTKIYQKQQNFIKNSPIRNQKSFRKLNDLNFKNLETIEKLKKEENCVNQKKYDQKIVKLRNYLRNMDF